MRKLIKLPKHVLKLEHMYQPVNKHVSEMGNNSRKSPHQVVNN